MGMSEHEATDEEPGASFGLWLKRRLGAILLFGLVIFPLTYILAYLLVQSLDWRIMHDSPILFYMGFLMDRFGFVPHRDFFDMNLVGSYLTCAAIGHVFGYTGLNLRYADFLCMGLIGLFVAVAFRHFGIRAIWMAVLVFPLRYMNFGPGMTFQREYFMLIPLAAAMAAAFAFPALRPTLRAGFVGFFFGLAASIKPHAAIGFPVLLVYLFLEASEEGRYWKENLHRTLWVGLAGALGFAVPVLAVVIYLAWNGALDDFLTIAFNYVPLYGSLSGNHTVLEGPERAKYLLTRMISLGGRRELALAGVFGAFAASWRFQENPSIRRQCGALVGLIAAYAIYPAFSGQFWSYHWLPLIFFSSLGVGLCFTRLPPAYPLLYRVIPVAVAISMLILMFHPERGMSHLLRDRRALPKNGRPDAIAKFLNEHLEPGDTVQPLDWAHTGVLHGMLLAEAKIATPFVYTFHFYHHVSTDYIKGLRKQFIDSLNEAKPKYIIEGKMGRPYVHGKDTSARFRALENLLKRDYTPVVKPSWSPRSMRLNARPPKRVRRGEGFIIWERKVKNAPDTPPESN